MTELKKGKRRQNLTFEFQEFGVLGSLTAATILENEILGVQDPVYKCIFGFILKSIDLRKISATPYCQKCYGPQINILN